MLFKAKLVWHVHEIITHTKIAYQLTSFLVGEFSTNIIAVSKQVKKHLIDSKRVKQNQVQVIYNGIDTEKFQLHEVKKKLYKEFDIQPSNLVLGMIGRLNAWKGQLTLLEAMIPLLKMNSNLRLMFVGGVFESETHFRDKLKTAIHASGVASQIVLKDMSDVYQLFDVFCLPSTSPDPLPTVVLEAMASGKPIIGLNHGGVTEKVVEGVNGYLADPVKVNSMSENINRLVTDKELIIKMGNASV